MHTTPSARSRSTDPLTNSLNGIHSTNSTNSPLSVGVIGRSRKPNERRLAIHPAHFERIDEPLRRRITLEERYGESYGYSDAQLAPLVGAILPRGAVIASSDVIVLPKPQPSDLAELRDGQILWGWPHCVQDEAITQLAIDKRLTLIAFEAMNHWASDSGFGLHVFHKNNELAGYSSVLHAMQLTGSTGTYGRRLRATVIGFGATARGAVTALNAHDVHDVRVLTSRSVAAVGSPIHSVEIAQFDQADAPPYLSSVITDRGRVPIAEFLAESDIIVNCTLQEPTAPLMYLMNDDLAAFTPGSLIVDVSCDAGMGFEWAKPTGFDDPMLTVGDHINYYAVDHSPCYYWNSATWEVSSALLPFLDIVMAGADSWQESETIRRAIEIRDGYVQNPDVLSFQHRAADYPHPVLPASG